MFRRSSVGHELMKILPKMKEIADPVSTVSTYLLLSQAGKQTPWHVDFTGTAVFYHVLVGEKHWWVLPPSKDSHEGLQLYNSHNPLSNHAFLPDLPALKKIPALHFVVKAGESVFLPPMWPHFVYTAKDSVVFGSNFLAGSGLSWVAKAYTTEMVNKVPPLEMFPAIEITVLVMTHIFRRTQTTGVLGETPEGWNALERAVLRHGRKILTPRVIASIKKFIHDFTISSSY